jgi:hypothetical protein
MLTKEISQYDVSLLQLPNFHIEERMYRALKRYCGESTPRKRRRKEKMKLDI